VTQLQAPFTSGALSFYWVDSGTSRTLGYSYTLSNGQSAVANATFNVDGPTGVSVAITQSTVNIFPPPTARCSTCSIMALENLSQPGIQFVASATHLPNPAGKYQWVQLLKTINDQYVTYLGRPIITNITGGPKVDTAYPYGYLNGNPLGTVTTTNGVTADTAQDSPGVD